MLVLKWSSVIEYEENSKLNKNLTGAQLVS